MYGICEDAYSDIFETVDDCEQLMADIRMQRLEDREDVDKNKLESVR